MKRREFIAILSGIVVTRPIAGVAQQMNMPVVGLLWASSKPEPGDRLMAGWWEGLGETGFVEGRNVFVEYRWGYERLPTLAADLVARKADVIFAAGGPAAFAAKAATSKIPIVFVVGGDPVGAGLVKSLNRPGGNITGVTNLGAPLQEKRLQLLHELTPDAASIGFLINPKNPLVPNQQGLVAAAARTAGVSVIELTASTPEEFEAAFMVGRRQGIGGLIVSDDPVMFQATQLVELSARYAIPAIYPSSLLARAGGLIAYSPSLEEIMRRAGAYVGRVLKGANPADLPVEQPTKFELVINLKTAKALSLTVPPPLLARADEVIE